MKYSNEVSRIRREMAKKSLYAFAKTYLSDHIKHMTSKEHHEIYKELEYAMVHRGTKIAIGGPRGFAKSELANMVYPLYCIVFKIESYIVILSATSAQASVFLQNIRQQLEQNKKLLEDFPELTGPRPSPWTKTEIQTPTGVRILALGVGQHIRGRKHGNHRPSLTIADDVENRLNTATPEQREKIKAWYTQDILGAGDEKTTHVFLGTVPHSSCLLAEILSPDVHQSWKKMRYRIIISEPNRQDLWEQCMKIYYGREKYENAVGFEAAKKFYESRRQEMDEGAVVLWPERWIYFNLRIQREENPLAFAAELQCEPLDPRTSIFNPDEYHSWDAEHKSPDLLIKSQDNQMDIFGGCDPSCGTDAKTGDPASISVVGRAANGTLYVLDSYSGYHTSDELIEMILAYHQKYKFKRFAIETNQAQIVIGQQLVERARQRSIQIPVEYLTNTANKIARIQRLQPLLKCGTIQICRNHQTLIDQMRYFPKGRHDDALDSLEMAIRVAEKSREARVIIVGGRGRGWGDDDYGPFNRAMRGR